MLAEAIRTLYGYNHWATERVLNAADGASLEQLLAPGGAGRGSIRDTLVHAFGTQRGWLSWWDDSLSPDEAYQRRRDPLEFADLAALRTLWEAVQQQTQAFVDGLTDADMARVYSQTLPNGAQWSMPLWQMMLHVANHGTQHRSEVAAMLTAAGHSPGDLDLLFYTPPQIEAPTG